MPTSLRNPALCLLAALATGCASLSPGARPGGPAGTPLAADVEWRHALPLSGNDGAGDDELLAGRVGVGEAGSLVHYAASYSIRRGKLLRALRDGDEGIDLSRGEIARQAVEQRLESALPMPMGAPMRVAISQRRLSKLELDRDATQRATEADLQWRPGPVDLALAWSPPAPVPVSGQALDCNLRARIGMPAAPLTGVAGSRLEFSGQRCSGHAPGRGIADLGVQRWAAAWSWGEDGNSALRLLHTRRRPSVPHRALPTPDYELGVSHRHVLPGGWEAEADVAVLQGSGAHPRQAGRGFTDWTARIALRQRLERIAITARAIHAPDARWLATAARTASAGRFSLALDFGAWLATFWPRGDSAMDLSWDWRETADGEPDARVRWNLVVGF